MCGGIVGLATPEFEQDVRRFFAARKIDLGGKTMEQYLEQLRVAVSFRERECHGIRAPLVEAVFE
jgi:puromycin-sensitive aminopeptidase